MPGLVNAHCHLDYTGMAGQFPPPKLFTDWTKLITPTKSEWSYSAFADSWVQGAQMLLRTGTTTVGDIEAAPELLPEVWDATPLRVISFIEMTGVRSRRRPATIVRDAVERIETLPSDRCRLGLSPHASHSTVPQLWRLSAEIARERRWPMAIHVAESELEFDMFMRAKGEMYDWIRRSGREMSDCGLGSPVQHLERCGALGPKLLAIHANYLAPKDNALLARRRVSVVHCPRSHFYFGHQPFPWSKLTKARVNVCLGTDSLASVCKTRRQTIELSMFEEMRTFATNHLAVSPRSILKMATLNSARALGLEGQVGELSVDAFADMITLPFAGRISSVHDAVLDHKGVVSGSMIGGRWVKGKT